MLQVDDLEIFQEKEYQELNRFYHTFDEIMYVIGSALECQKCKIMPTVIVNDFANLINCEITRKISNGQFIYTGSFSLNNGLVVNVNKTAPENRNNLAYMGSHLLIECSKCKRNYMR